MFVYVVLRAKFVKVKYLVFHKFFIFVGASPFLPSEVDQMSTRDFWELSGKK